MDPVIEHEVAETVDDVTARFDHAIVGERIGRAACDSIPQLRRHGDPDIVDETVLAATANVVAIIDGLRVGADPCGITAPSVSLQWADWLVGRGIDVSTVPWAYSFGQSRMADALREVVIGLDVPAENKWRMGDSLSRYVNAYVESVCAQMVEHFVESERRWRGGTPALRRDLVDAMLAGRPVDPAAASRDLGYPLQGAHLGAIVWTDAAPETRHPEQFQREAAERLLRACGAREVLTLANGDSSVWAWGTGAELCDLPDGAIHVEGELRAALGTIASGADGFVRSHRDAGKARHMAGLLARRPGSVIPYRSVALTALIASDPEQAVRFLEAELGPLMDDSDQVRRLRATLTIYFEEGMRPVKTARRLGVHQNTIAYRISQAEQAIGRPLTERRLELEAALRLADARDALREAGRAARSL
jgi:hypothetical protein